MNVHICHRHLSFLAMPHSSLLHNFPKARRSHVWYCSTLSAITHTLFSPGVPSRGTAPKIALMAHVFWIFYDSGEMVGQARRSVSSEALVVLLKCTIAQVHTHLCGCADRQGHCRRLWPHLAGQNFQRQRYCPSLPFLASAHVDLRCE